MNRTKGFANQNRFKSGRAIKELGKTADDKHRTGVEKKRQRSRK